MWVLARLMLYRPKQKHTHSHKASPLSERENQLSFTWIRREHALYHIVVDSSAAVFFFFRALLLVPMLFIVCVSVLIGKNMRAIQTHWEKAIINISIQSVSDNYLLRFHRHFRRHTSIASAFMVLGLWHRTQFFTFSKPSGSSAFILKRKTTAEKSQKPTKRNNNSSIGSNNKRYMAQPPSNIVIPHPK